MNWFYVLCLKQLVLNTCCFVVLWIVLPLGSLCWFAIGRGGSCRGGVLPVSRPTALFWRQSSCAYARMEAHATVMAVEGRGWSPETPVSFEERPVHAQDPRPIYGIVQESDSTCSVEELDPIESVTQGTMYAPTSRGTRVTVDPAAVGRALLVKYWRFQGWWYLSIPLFFLFSFLFPSIFSVFLYIIVLYFLLPSCHC